MNSEGDRVLKSCEFDNTVVSFYVRSGVYVKMASTADLVTDSVADLSGSEHGKSDEKTFLKMGFKEKIAYIREMTTIEPLLVLYILASIVCGPAINDLQIEMACFGNKGYDETVCAALFNETAQDETVKNQSSEVGRIRGDVASWSAPVQNFVPVIYLIFLGTFSDRHKIRKPFLLIPIVGEFFACVCCILCVIYKKSWPIEVEAVAQVIVPSLLGGPTILAMAAYAYISDVSTPEKRVARIAMMQLCLNIGGPIGMIFTAIIYPYIGSIASFALGFLFFLLAFIYGFIKVKEPRASGEESNVKSLIADIFNPQHAIETFKLLVETKGGQRKNIIFILAICFISSLISSGEVTIFSNSFVNHAYRWDGTDLTYYGAAQSVLSLIALGVGIPLLSNVFGLPDLLIIAVAYADKIIANIVILIIATPCGLYMSLVAGILSGVGGAGLTSQTTKYVSEDDIGKVQSLLLIIGVIGGIIGIQIYNAIWKQTDNWYPQAFFYLGIIVFVPTILALVWKYYKEKNNPPIVVPVDANDTEMQNQKNNQSPNA